jgi:hypothetical protein
VDKTTEALMEQTLCGLLRRLPLCREVTREEVEQIADGFLEEEPALEALAPISLAKLACFRMREIPDGCEVEERAAHREIGDVIVDILFDLLDADHGDELPVQFPF